MCFWIWLPFTGAQGFYLVLRLARMARGPKTGSIFPGEVYSFSQNNSGFWCCSTLYYNTYNEIMMTTRNLKGKCWERTLSFVCWSPFVFSYLYINYTMSEMLRNFSWLMGKRHRSWVTPTPPAVQTESFHLNGNSLDLLPGLNITFPPGALMDSIGHRS